MTPTAQADAHIDFRLSPEHKDLIEQAAALRGQSLSDFAATILIEKASELLEAGGARTLSERDARRFLELLDADLGPNEALRKAAERYKTHHG